MDIDLGPKITWPPIVIIEFYKLAVTQFSKLNAR